MTRPLVVMAITVGLLACALPQQPAAAVDLVLTSRSVSLTGKLTLAMAEKTVDKLIELDSISADPIFLRINAHGDAVEAAFAIVDTMRALRSPVQAVVQSRAYDAAAIVAVLCEKTWVFPNSVLMFAPVDKVSTEVTAPKEPDKEFLERFRSDVYGAVADAIGMKRETFAERVTAGWWLTAEQSVEARVADGIVDGLTFRELFIEQTEIKTTVTTIEEKQLPPASGTPQPAPDGAAHKKRR